MYVETVKSHGDKCNYNHYYQDKSMASIPHLLTKDAYFTLHCKDIETRGELEDICKGLFSKRGHELLPGSLGDAFNWNWKQKQRQRYVR